MKKQLTISLIVLSNLVLSSVLRADVRLPSVLGHGMVLQQGKTVSIWGWADAGEKVSVAFGNQTSESVADAKGKWIIKLGKMKANSEGSTLSVTGKNKVEVKDVLVGEVWLCSGQSNMKFGMKNSKYMDEEIPKAQYPNIRLFQVPANKSRSEFCEDVNGMWQKCTPETVATFSAVAYHFGKNLHENLNVPIALIQSAVGATPIGQWIALEGKKKVNSLKGNGSGPCYKGMIHPLINLSIRGVIWYQGETNVIYGDTDIYTDKMIALVEGWRETFMDKDMSFYFVQLPPYTYSTRKGTRNLTPESLAKVWDAQSLCLKKISNCGMVVISDMLESVGNIHPENKRGVGYRLSLWAMAKNYGKSEVVYSGPIYSSMKNDGNRIRLEFDYVGGGLRSLDGKALSQFQIAGSDKVFKDVIATISGATVILEHQDIASPVAARFAWHEAKIGNLGNQEGLPASPFRTDKW